MQPNATRTAPIPRLLFCGLFLAASLIGWSSPVAAFGMGGFHMGGGFARPGGGYGAGPRKPVTALHPGAGRHANTASSLNGRHAGLDGGRGSRGNPGGGGGDRNPGSERNPPTPISAPPSGSGRDTVATQGLIGAGAGGGGASSGVGGGAGGGNTGGSGVPPRGERRFVPDEVITAFASSATPQSIDRIARRYNLTRLESQSFPLTGRTLYRWRVGGHRPVADVVGALEGERIVASAQPNYIFTLQDQLAARPAETAGDAAQYVLAKLQIAQAHQLATGHDILVAVIDSQIDAGNPNLEGTVVKSFAALAGEATPQRHGTAMAGAIAAHGRLLGIAPRARLLAARAFGGAPDDAKGTSFAIYKALQWAADNDARIVNMSFAGPADPDLHRMLAAAYEKGMVLIAAAGNAGPNSPPLYPAADSSVIAVTATDSNDGLYDMANHGAYIRVAAPGVEILAVAPGESLQITTGTSVAAAHVSGLAALLLELSPSLKPQDIRAIITASAKPVGSAGLVDAYQAVMALDGQSVGQGKPAGEGQTARQKDAEQARQ